MAMGRGGRAGGKVVAMGIILLLLCGFGFSSARNFPTAGHGHRRGHHRDHHPHHPHLHHPHRHHPHHLHNHPHHLHNPHHHLPHHLHNHPHPYCHTSHGGHKVCTVGNSAGWTTPPRTNFTAWAYSNTFNVGDAIVFKYNPRHHNVLRVADLEAYHSCNRTSPLATHTTGHDSFTFQTKGHYYFIDGISNHCHRGQKVNIRILVDGEHHHPSTLADHESSTIFPPPMKSLPTSGGVPRLVGGYQGVAFLAHIIALLLLLS